MALARSALVTMVVAGLLLVPAAAIGATPIPQNPADLVGLDLFTGQVATPRPVSAPKPPRHPFMAANGRSNVHNDAYQTDTYWNAGPLGRDMRTYSQAYGGLGSCGITIVFDKQGRLLTTCISATSVQLRLMDPKTLDTVATHVLPPRVIPEGKSPFQTPGGAYFYLDNKDRAVVSMNRKIFVVAIEGNTLRRVRTYDVARWVPADDQLNSALPDWKGRLWFVSRQHGIVGALNRRTGKLLGKYRTGEAIGNSFAMDETGGVFVVTDRAQYRFDATRRGKPKLSWRFRYDNIRKQKPGPVRRRVGHHADADGRPLPVDSRQRRPDAGGGPAPGQAAPARQAPAGVRAARVQEGRRRHRELDHRDAHLDDRREQLRLRAAADRHARTAPPRSRASSGWTSSGAARAAGPSGRARRSRRAPCRSSHSPPG